MTVNAKTYLMSERQKAVKKERSYLPTLKRKHLNRDLPSSSDLSEGPYVSKQSYRSHRQLPSQSEDG